MRVLAALLVVASMTMADTILWDESVDGDLTLAGGFVGSVGVGSNLVTGTNNSFDGDDNFTFTLGAGLRITDVTMSVTGVPAPRAVGLSGFGTGNELLWSHLIVNVGSAALTGGSVALFAPLPYSSAGTYRISQTDFSPGVIVPYDYTISIEVESASGGADPVPEPGTSYLLGAALIGYAVYRRRLGRRRGLNRAGRP